MEYQLVSGNIVEKSVNTFKGHVVAVLCETDAKFPMQLWCRIQAEHQLNHICKSRVVPKVSAFLHL